MSETIKVTIEQATVADFRRIETRTGRPMVRFRVTVGKDRLAVIVFNEAAERLDLADGDRVNVIGRLEGTNWTAADGSNRYGWQVIAEQVEQAGQDRHTAPPTSSTSSAPPTSSTSSAPPTSSTSSAPPTSSTRPTSPTRPTTGKRQDRQVRMFNGADPGPHDYVEGPF